MIDEQKLYDELAERLRTLPPPNDKTSWQYTELFYAANTMQGQIRRLLKKNSKPCCRTCGEPKLYYNCNACGATDDL